MTRINTNVGSLIAQQNLANSNNELQTSLTRLSTGLRINSGADDPAGLIAHQALQSEITATNSAIQNNQIANDIVSTADSALGQVSTLLNTIRGLISASANTGANSSDQIAADQLQVDAALQSIDRISQSTSFQGRQLLDGSLNFITTSPGTIESAASSTFGTSANVNATAIVKANVGGTTGGDIKITAIGANAAGAGNNFTVSFVDGAQGAAPTVALNGSSLVFTISSGVTTANQLVTALGGSALSAQFSASLVNNSTGSGVFDGGTGFTNASITAGSGSDILITATGLAGTNGNSLSLAIQTGSAASVTLSGNDLTITVQSGVTTANDLITALASSNASGAVSFSKINGNAGTTAAFATAATASFAGGANGTSVVATTSGGTDGNQIDLVANTPGASSNGITVRLQTGGTAGSELASFDGSSKTLTVTIQSGVSTAAQIATAISNQGLFSATVDSGSNGTGSIVSSTTSTSSAGTSNLDLQNIQINQADFGTASQEGVQVAIQKQATQAQLSYAGGTLTNALSLQLGGDQGYQTFNFGGGTTIQQIATAVNQASDTTGVQAKINGTQLELQSTDYGSSAFVQAQVLNVSGGGVFNTTDINNASVGRANGTDVQATINGIEATAHGLNASVNTASLNVNISISNLLAAGAAVNFNITGGGAEFQLGPDIISSQQARLGIQGVSTSQLGGLDGTLSSIATGGANTLANNPTNAAAIVDEAIAQVSDLQGRLGAFQSSTINTNIASLNNALSNLSSADSTIADTDFAAESAKLTRAQILVQAGTSVLSVANNQPQQILNLLKNIQ